MLPETHSKSYAIPAILWICTFLLTKRFPGLLKTLSMRFSSEEASLGMTNLDINHLDPLSSSGLDSVGSTSSNAASRNVAWIGLLHSPVQLFHFCVSLFRWSGEFRSRNRSYRRALVILGTSMSSLLVHTSRWNLINSIIVYAYTLSIGKRHFQRYEAVADVLGGFLGATLTNIFLYLRMPIFCPSKQRFPPRLGLLGERSFLLGIGSALIVMLTTLFPFHSFSTHLITSVPPRISQKSTEGVSDNERTSPTTRELPLEATTTNESARITGSHDSSFFDHPSIARTTACVCGGETFSYALSGFRFIYRSDVAQLRGAVWGYWIDWLHNYSSDIRAPWWLSGFATDLLGSGDFEETTSISGTLFFTSTTSPDLHHMNTLAFVMGGGVAWAAKLIPKLSIVNYFIGLFYELPPPPIVIPSELIDSVLTDLSVIRVYTACPCSSSSISVNSHSADQINKKAKNNSSTNMTVPLGNHTASEDYVDISILPECICPITRNIMSDPVITVDGFTYDREAIEEWLHHRNSSPMTNLPLRDTTLVSNRQIYRKVQEVVAAYNDAIRGK
ncbi:unnamed protein product [Phytomonas sp. Hart1]|nr:unnamed protein product [Phytomonas sp. Hart1]|eukprot:CCW71213.1 unnamed protein product [Phytomonas sp. isolate Hart1]